VGDSATVGKQDAETTPSMYGPTADGTVPAADDDPGRIGLDPTRVLPRRIAWWARREPDRPFLVEVTGRTATYGETLDGVRRWCAELAARGVRRGDRVVSLLPSCVDAHLVWLAASCLGAYEVPVNPELRGEFLRHVLTDAGAVLCVARPATAHLPALAGVELATLVVGPAGLPPGDLADLADLADPAEPYPADADASSSPTDAAARLPAPADPSCVIYTSGSTSMPKGVIVTWGQMSAVIGRIPRSWLSETDAVYSYLPMFHVTGRTPLVVMSDVGGRVVLRERFSVSAFWDDVRAFRVTSTTAHVSLLLAAPERPDDRDNPMRVVFGGHSADQNRRFAERFDLDVLDAYGSTEAGFPILLRRPRDASRRWCGWVRRGYTARIVDEQRVEVPDGTVGELEIRPPAPELIAAGYLGLPAKTAEVFVDGWYRTGDALVRHPDGCFEFIDRIRDTIRRLGENISASAMEEVVVTDPDITDCAVIGVPDEILGQAVLLAVEPRPGIVLDAEAVARRLVDILPRHMHPAFVDVWDALPRTPNNKVRKPDVLAGHESGEGPSARWTAAARHAGPRPVDPAQHDRGAGPEAAA